MSVKFKSISRMVLTMALLLIVCGLQAQTITGTVIDATGEAVIGATVQEQGTQNATVTDLDGNFSLKVSGNKPIVVSYIGMKTQTIDIKGKSQVKVTMEDDNTTLEELVVIGYGTARKKDLTGAVSTVKGSDLVQVPVTNVAEALTGKLAGVQITTTDGSPDAEMIVKVRGGGSITGDNSPLYIVDGFPVSSISDISSSDIEDITVLKDAASTAIYGSQGANGVILITTKSAKSGKTQVSYNMYIQGKTLRKKLDTMDPYQYVMFLYERAALQGNSGISSFEKRFGSFDDLDLYKYQSGHDWQEEMFGNHEISTSHNISISGGSDKTKFTLSGTYANDNSLMEGNGYRRYNLNFKLKHEIVKNLDLDFGVRLADTQTKGVGTGGGSYKIRSYDAIMTGPVFGLYDQIEIDPSALPEDEYEEYINATRTLKDRVNDYWRRKDERKYNFNAALNWKITKNFIYRLEGGYDYTFYQLKDWFGARSSKAVQDGGSLPMGQWDKRDSWKLRGAHTLTYKNTFNKIHDVNVMIGQEYVGANNETMSMVGKYFQRDIQPEKMFASMQNNSHATGAQTISSNLGQEDRTISFFGRVNYTLMDRYLLTLTFREDGSSKFAEGNRWGFFPAAAFGWRIIEEPWMEKAKSWMSNLKLRLSYGTAGNNRISNAMYVTQYKAYSGSKYYGATNQQNPHYTLQNSQLANPDLKWETTITRNVGLDFGFLNGRINGTIDAYWNTTKDLLMLTTLPGITGFTTTFANIGQTSNKGIEVSLNGTIFQNKDWTVSAGFNINFNKNNVDELADGVTGIYGTSWFSSGNPSNDFILEEDEAVGRVRGLKYVGMYTTDDFTYDAATGVYTLKPGVPDVSASITGVMHGLANNVPSGQNAYPGMAKYQDTDGNGSVDSADYTVIGDMNPTHTGGFNINVVYKNWDLGAYFNWSYGNEIYNINRMASLMGYKETGVYQNHMAFMNQCYKIYDVVNNTLVRYNSPEELNALNVDAKYPLCYNENGVVSDLGIEDGSYLRLGTLTLGYTLPKSLISRLHISNLRVYGTVYNLLTISDYSGLDPEVSTNGNLNNATYPTPGVDWGAYPRARSFVVGLNINF